MRIRGKAREHGGSSTPPERRLTLASDRFPFIDVIAVGIVPVGVVIVVVVVVVVLDEEGFPIELRRRSEAKPRP